MSKEIEKVIQEKADRIKEKVKSEIESTTNYRIKELEEYVEGLKESVKIVLPVNVLDIMTNGGVVLSTVHEIRNYDANIMVTGTDNSNIFYNQRSMLTFGKGKYRITLIIEKVK